MGESRPPYIIFIKPNMKAKLWEATKELLRYIVLAIPALIISWLAQQSFNAEIVLIVTTILRFLDKVLHDWGKESGSTTLEGGLTRF